MVRLGSTGVNVKIPVVSVALNGIFCACTQPRQGSSWTTEYEISSTCGDALPRSKKSFAPPSWNDASTPVLEGYPTSKLWRCVNTTNVRVSSIFFASVLVVHADSPV